MSNYELNNEEKQILKKHNELQKIQEEKEQLFWTDVYPTYSIENRVNYWLGNIHHGMRMQGEVTNDPYSEFSKEWYDYVKSIENNFDFIFKEVVPKLGFNFNWTEYQKRIEKH